jgi:hypothetical protein
LKRGGYKGQSKELNGSNFEFAVKRAHRDKLSKKFNEENSMIEFE